MKETYLLHRSATEITLPTTTAPTRIWERFASQIRGWFEVPLGYEDENGFHYGPEPRPTLTASVTREPRQVFTDRVSDTIQFATELTRRPESTPAEQRRVSA